jgi:hypothetical protein
MNYCKFAADGVNYCDKVARFKVLGQWYCADHFDAIVADHQGGCDGCAGHDTPPQEKAS